MLTQWFVFTADVTLVTMFFQCVEQEAVVQLSGAVRLMPVWDLSDLYVSWTGQSLSLLSSKSWFQVSGHSFRTNISVGGGWSRWWFKELKLAPFTWGLFQDEEDCVELMERSTSALTQPTPASSVWGNSCCSRSELFRNQQRLHAFVAHSLLTNDR